MSSLTLARGEEELSVRSLSDSDASSDFDDSRDSCSSDEFESPSATPRSDSEEMAKSTPEGTPVQLRQQSTMKPKVPILGLRQDVNTSLCGPADATPRKGGQSETARGRPAIPGLAFKPDSQVRGVPALPPMAAFSSRQSRSVDHASARAGARSQAHAAVTVSLMSPGLSVLSNKPEESTTAEAALGQLSRQLGIRQVELKLFQLREVEGACSLASEGSQYAVAVSNSRECRLSALVYTWSSACKIKVLI